MNSNEGSVRKRGERGKGTIRVTKAGNYEYRISYRDEFNQHRVKSFTAETVDECVDRAERFKEDLRLKKGGISPDDTVADIMRRKADIDYAKNHTGEQGYSRTLSTIKSIEKYGLGRMRIEAVKPRHLSLFLEAITGYSDTVINKMYGLLRSTFRYAYDCGAIPFNYMLLPELRCPKSDKRKKKVRGLTEEEQSRFLEGLAAQKTRYGCNSYKLQLLIELYGGLRMGEINALRPENIHLDKGYIHVDSTISIGLDNRSFINDRAKTEAGVRDVPISRTLRPVLEQALAQMKKNPYGLVFYDYRKNGLIETSQVNYSFRRLMKQLGIPVTGQHALRHTFATRCIEAGIPPVVLKKWLGHTNIHVTLDTYADVFDRMNFGATEKFDDLMEKLEEQQGKNENAEQNT